MLQEILTVILIPVAGAVGTLIAVLLQNLISKIRNEHLQTLAYMGVYAIEQKYPELKGQDKYKKVVEYLASKMKYITEDQINVAIESAVKQFNISIGKNIPSDVKKNIS